MTTELTTVDFHGATLLAVRGDTPQTTLVVMKPVVEGIGLAWQSQLEKIKAHPVFGKGITEIVIPSAGGPQAMSALPLTRLNFWLATIQPNKVPDLEIRARVIRYQTECADVLFAHFFGKAVGGLGHAEDLRMMITAAAADIQREVTAQVSAIVHAELVQTVQQLVPEIITATLIGDPRVAAIAGVSVRELLDQAGAQPKGRDGLNRRIGNRLRTEALSSGVILHRCARTGTWLFPIAFAEDGMRRFGDALVRAHNDQMTGQGVLRFPDRRRKQDVDAATPETSP